MLVCGMIISYMRAGEYISLKEEQRSALFSTEKMFFALLSTGFSRSVICKQFPVAPFNLAAHMRALHGRRQEATRQPQSRKYSVDFFSF